MIVRDFFETRSDGVRLFKTYSDSGLMIRQNESGNIYSEAVDVENAPFTYSETDEAIETDKDIEI
jgi:hypothetical protein